MATFQRRFEWERRPFFAKTHKGLPLVGGIAFVAGLILSILAGIWFPDVQWAVAGLAILGIVIGLACMASSINLHALLAATALMVIGATEAFTQINAVQSGWGDTLNTISRHVATLMAPVAVLTAIGCVLDLRTPSMVEHQVAATTEDDIIHRRAA